MEIGIMAKTFARVNLEGVLDAVQSHGFRSVQFNMTCAGLPPMPDRIDPEVCDRVRSELARRGIALAAVSGTFNMIHPDLEARRTGMRRLEVLAAACGRLGAPVITLCTGTRDPDDMWRRHPDNDSPEAWTELLQAIREAARLAERHRVTLAFEPEVSNVIDSARKARRLLDEVGSAHLKVVLDGANLFHAGELPRMREILDEAFELLRGDIVLAHAKDLSRDGEAGHEAAGTGLLDYDAYLGRLIASGYRGHLILHSLTEAQADGCSRFLHQKLRGRFSAQLDGIRFHGRRAGSGRPFFFQHGLGGDVEQPFGLFPPPPGIELVSFDWRGHGLTRPLGPEEKIGIPAFADDLAAMLDELGHRQAIIGGISLGAAVALNFALRFPERTLGLVLSRPAWLAGPNQANAAIFGRIASLIRRHGPERGKKEFLESPQYLEILRDAPDCAGSLASQFDSPRAADAAARLERIPADAPCRDLGLLGAIRAPVLVLANRRDPIHPFEFGGILAQKIPGAELHEIASKSDDRSRHEADTRRFLAEFLERHFSNRGGHG